MLKIACIQLTSSADMLDNIVNVESLVALAVEQGAKFIFTPECTFLMENLSDKKHFKNLIYTQDKHPAIKASANMAKKHKIWLLIGSIYVSSSESKKNYNRSFLFNPQGEIVEKYDKIHLFDVEIKDGQSYRESAKTIAGSKSILAQSPWGKIGMSVCYDLRFPQLYRALAKGGASIITVPAAFTQVTGEAHWHILLRARAIETGCFIVAPAQTGTHAGGRKTYGHSLIIDPWGRIITDGGIDKGIIVADLDLSEIETVRKKLPSLQHDREFS